MLTRREIVLIIILLFMISGTGYFMLFFIPVSQELATLRTGVESRTMEIAEAQTRTVHYAVFSNVRDERAVEWEDAMIGVPDFFDDADILRRIQRIIYPHTWQIETAFSNSEESGGGLWVSRVDISFTANRDGLTEILQDFKDDDLDKRLINYTINAEDIILGHEGLMFIHLGIEFLSIRGDLVREE